MRTFICSHTLQMQTKMKEEEKNDLNKITERSSIVTLFLVYFPPISAVSRQFEARNIFSVCLSQDSVELPGVRIHRSLTTASFSCSCPCSYLYFSLIFHYNVKCSCNENRLICVFQYIYLYGLFFFSYLESIKSYHTAHENLVNLFITSANQRTETHIHNVIAALSIRTARL